MSNHPIAWLSSLSRAARASLALAACAIVAGFIALALWALSPDYQVLFSDLDNQDGSAIVAELDRLKIPYRFADDGKTVLVEQDKVYKTRLQLMGRGVNLKGTVGFEIFNESDFGMTDFAQRIKFQRALQGELARTIMGLEEVQSARVHLVVPESGFLKKTDKQAKASVTVTTRPGQQLSPQQVLGIQRLVAAAVPEIDAHAITVLNSRGVTLSRPADAAQDGSGDARLAIKQQTEAYLGSKITAILDQTFGAGRSTVSVDVTLDHDSLKITREDVLPAATANGDADGAIVRRKNSSRRAGTPASAAQDKPAAAGVAAARAGDDEQATDEIEYQHGRKIEQLVSTPGSIKRLSVGVVIPDPIGADRIDMLSKVIAMSAGLNSARGDALAIYPAYPASGAAASATARDQETVSRAADAVLTVTPADMAQPAGVANAAQATATARAGKHGTSANQNLGLPGQVWLLSAVAALAAVSLALLVWMLTPRHRASKRLGPAERERALQELQAWLNEPSAATSPGRGVK
ncbi:flagellar basal-body MS-ring/collar protein FliF [Lacisediminimonas sp.]|uniref:flagellar basal-body MS-ring/collar protein FliF n=1 Tax=Lacisediminimonas sp. TaxID=3060582 RepID=UPI0027160903|nr:flagellar basal-body MS-ring/collar protein FliF [Lacisediminimonas sp.]MDO8299545.1 flagellar basal-body MS-ring/collar protein FliF [Lacisediminimonas sp.]